VDGGVVVGFFEVDGAGDGAVHGGAAEFFVGDVLADGGFDEGGAGEVEAGAFGHDEGVAEDGEVSAAGDAVAHDGGDLGDALGGEDGVEEEDASEVVGVGEDVFLHGEEDAGGVDEVDEGEAGHARDGLGADDLLAGHGEEGAGLHGGVVGDDHVGAGVDVTDAGDDAGGGGAAVVLVHVVGGPEGEFLEARALIDESFDAFAGGEAVFLVLALDCLGAAAEADLGLGLEVLGGGGAEGCVGHAGVVRWG
jgi:hypothetical protein